MIPVALGSAPVKPTLPVKGRRKKLKRLIISSDKILSLSAILIALASIFVTIWESSEIRRHNRLSVRPKLEIFFNYDPGCRSMEWILCNNGIGPGIIKDSRIIIDKKAYPINNGAIFDNVGDILGLEGLSIMKISSMNSGLALIKEETMKPIFRFELKSKVKEEDFWKLHDRIEFKIDYESMYLEQFYCQYPM